MTSSLSQLNVQTLLNSVGLETLTPSWKSITSNASSCMSRVTTHLEEMVSITPIEYSFPKDHKRPPCIASIEDAVPGIQSSIETRSQSARL